MISFFRWRFVPLLFAAGLVASTAVRADEFCPHCAQKDGAGHAQKYGPTQKYGPGSKGGKGMYQKGHATLVREHGWFHSAPPPDAPVLESAAIRRVPLPQQVNYRIQRESGQLRAESGRAPQPESGAAPSDDVERRLRVLEEHVTRIYASLDKLVEQLQQ